jgi:hypothetical protein
LTVGAAEFLWLRQILKELGTEVKENIPVFEDNQACIHALDNWDQRRMKHVDIKYNFVKDLHKIGIINVQSSDQIADFLAKGLPYETFCRHRVSFRICKIRSWGGV